MKTPLLAAGLAAVLGMAVPTLAFHEQDKFSKEAIMKHLQGQTEERHVRYGWCPKDLIEAQYGRGESTTRAFFKVSDYKAHEYDGAPLPTPVALFHGGNFYLFSRYTTFDGKLVEEYRLQVKEMDKVDLAVYRRAQKAPCEAVQEEKTQPEKKP